MAMNVFGNPIAKATLSAMPEYEGKEITPKDLAVVAFNMKNAGGKDFNVRQFVENVGKSSKRDMTTLCVIYNATGGKLTFVSKHDWCGHLGESPYPVTIANGQWAGFVHVEDLGSSSGSHAAVVYRGLSENDTHCDWLMSWRNPKDRDYSNTAYTAVHWANHFEDKDTMKTISKRKDDEAGLVKIDSLVGCRSSISTGDGYKAVVEAIFSLDCV